MFVPFVPYADIDPTHDDVKYFKAWFDWFGRTFDVGLTIFVGYAQPNSSGLWVGYIYGTRPNDYKDGVLKYCGGIYMGLTGYLRLAGYNNGTWYYRQVTTS